MLGRYLHQARGSELGAGQQAAAKDFLTEADATIAVLDITLDPASLMVSVDGRPLRLGLGGAGVAFGGAAGVLAGVAAGTWSDAQAVCPQTDRCPDDQGFELSHQARFEARLATAALVTAGAALAGGVALWLAAPSALDEPDVALRVGPTHVGVAGHF